MNQDQFVARYRDRWQELTHALTAVQRKGPRRLTSDQVRTLGRLYRQTASDLAYARTYFPGSPTAAYLNRLVAQAHSVVYAEEPQRLRSIWRFFWRKVPKAVREAYRPLLLATALVILGGLVGFVAILADPNLAEALVPEQFRYVEAQPREGEIFPVALRSVIGTAIMLNNIKVGLTAFALGITLGLGTGAILFYNGLIVGALSAHFFRAGLSFQFWSLIVPHGMLELMAIFLCGAAGFCMGWPIVSPGDLPRLEAFRLGARRALTLTLGAIPFFVIAAVIEGFITPMSSLSAGGKYLVGLITGAAGLAYWLWAGRRPTAAPAP